MQYRTAFLFDLLATGFITTIEFGSLALIFQRFDNIAGWTLAEIAFLYGLIAIAFGTMDILFSGFDPQFFGQQVRRGSFDQLLLRPADITVQVLGSEFVMRRLGRIAQGLLIFIIALILLKIQWTVGKILYLPVVYISQVLFFGGLFIIGATISFWTVESLEAVNIFTYGGNEMMSYPMHIYPKWMVRFFTFIIPAIFLNYYPALYFLDKTDPFNLPSIARFLAPAAGIGVMLIALAFWRYGIRHYQSTGT
jgi:ABC-2 type transport system permease protein